MNLSTTVQGSLNFGLLEMTIHECGQCGTLWAMTDAFLENRRRDHRNWYCPNGHIWHFSGESDIEKAKRQAKEASEALARERARHDQTQASLSATRGVVTRQRKKLEKVVAGICPVDECKRHFKDLRRHIETKHPDFKGEVGTSQHKAKK